ncbi:MAG: hypothetical protein KGS49_14410, partial [Planctomycetes bacterium]|nr:hypothetical protein [Planctomycetota bacterium]
MRFFNLARTLLIIGAPLSSFGVGLVQAIAQDAPAGAPAQAPAAVSYKSLVVYPPSIKISAQNDLQHIVAVATRSDGITVDVSDQVQWKLENPAVAKLENLVLHPLADGATQLI